MALGLPSLSLHLLPLPYCCFSFYGVSVCSFNVCHVDFLNYRFAFPSGRLRASPLLYKSRVPPDGRQ